VRGRLALVLDIIVIVATKVGGDDGSVDSEESLSSDNGDRVRVREGATGIGRLNSRLNHVLSSLSRLSRRDEGRSVGISESREDALVSLKLLITIVNR
jgi:hypothetical protein